jgi:hypothetical protein
MAIYFCYHLGKDGRISGRHEVEATSDAEAVTACQAIKNAARINPHFEVWLGSRRVYSTEPG